MPILLTPENRRAEDDSHSFVLQNGTELLGIVDTEGGEGGQRDPSHSASDLLLSMSGQGGSVPHRVPLTQGWEKGSADRRGPMLV